MFRSPLRVTSLRGRFSNHLRCPIASVATNTAWLSSSARFQRQAPVGGLFNTQFASFSNWRNSRGGRRQQGGQNQRQQQNTKKKSKPNFYELLALDPECAQSKIKPAFLQQAKLHHPDRGGDAKKFDELNNAYKILNDPHKRRAYDRSLENGEEEFDQSMYEEIDWSVSVNLEHNFISIGGQALSVPPKVAQGLGYVGVPQIGPVTVPNYNGYIFWSLLGVLLLAQARSAYKNWKDKEARRVEGIPADFVDYNRPRFVARVLCVAAVGAIMYAKRSALGLSHASLKSEKILGKAITVTFTYTPVIFIGFTVATLLGPLPLWPVTHWLGRGALVDSQLLAPFWDTLHYNCPIITQCAATTLALIWAMSGNLAGNGGLRAIFKTRINPAVLVAVALTGRVGGFYLGHLINGIFTSPLEYVDSSTPVERIATHATLVRQHVATLCQQVQQAPHTPVTVPQLLALSQAAQAVIDQCDFEEGKEVGQPTKHTELPPPPVAKAKTPNSSSKKTE